MQSAQGSGSVQPPAQDMAPFPDTLWCQRMFGRSGSPPVTWPHGQRWLLVVLTLIASVAHLARSPQAGGLGLPGILLAQTTIDPGAPAAPPAHRHSAGMDISDLGGPGNGAQAAAGPGARPASAWAPELADAAPNAPPHHGHHTDAHCPFCLTAGFALEAQPGFSVVRVVPHVLRAALSCPQPFLAGIRHADPRAPPPRNSLTSADA